MISSAVSSFKRRDAGFIAWAMVASFATYFAMYAYRKPFVAASFSGLQLGGMDYKIVLVIAQILGYMCSKFIGIKFISELRPAQRIFSLFALLGLAELALVGFALTPFPYNFPFLFLNGLPLGMIFGIVFSFLEGRRFTEIISAGLGISIIMASGAVKTVGRILLDDYGITQWWMPAVTGLLFVPLVLGGVWMLAAIPPPDAADTLARSERAPMDAAGRRALFRRYRGGLVLLILLYVILTAFRDIRDNFAIEIWTALGYSEQPGILSKSEFIIALLVLMYIAAASFITHNERAFRLNLAAIGFGGVLLIGCTLLYQWQIISPEVWMIAGGLGLFIGYTVYQGFLFERLIAVFREPANVGFLMYLADSFGYLGSVGVLFAKNFAAPRIAWLPFFTSAAYVVGVAATVLPVAAYLYFRRKFYQPTN